MWNNYEIYPYNRFNVKFFSRLKNDDAVDRNQIEWWGLENGDDRLETISIRMFCSIDSWLSKNWLER